MGKSGDPGVRLVSGHSHYIHYIHYNNWYFGTKIDSTKWLILGQVLVQTELVLVGTERWIN